MLSVMSEPLVYRSTKKVSAGKFYPWGASLQSGGVNFTLYSQAATAVFLLLFDRPDAEPTDVIELRHKTRHIWHVFVAGLKAGQLYGYKVRGEFNPAAGLRFNENKLMIDPCAKALTGKARNIDNLLLAYDANSAEKDLSFDTRDNSRVVPKSIVIDDRFDWQGDRAPEIPLEKTLIYETHLKGFTAHPSSQVAQPGTYLGLIEKIPYLQSLGITAVELLPLHEYYVDDFLLQRGLTNYWGYNSIGFYAPESSYSSTQKPGAAVEEFKMLVRELHKNNIEVILDVVYNHTGEGSELGPTLCFRGIDNGTYYSLCGGESEPYRFYLNDTGCGNTFNFSNKFALTFVMNSLRYWADVMHVDGFRFDLASVMGKREGKFQHSAAFFDVIAQDPLLTRKKLIAEPWDLSTYEVGHFPLEWSEWNGKFRDGVRRFIKGDPGMLPEMARRLTGSADLYANDGRAASNSINFVTCHDGFTLYDLVSYNDKHNEANGEDNHDGAGNNDSWNCGAEGDTDDPAILALRQKQAKNLMCALLFAAGTPMIHGGDEVLFSRKGNNNGFCQDNDLNWLDWSRLESQKDFLDFVKKAVALTKRYPILQRSKFFYGQDLNDDGEPDIRWFSAVLNEPPRWDDPESKLLCCQLDGAEEDPARGTYQLFLIFNAGHTPQDVELPQLKTHRWHRVIDTSLPAGQDIQDSGRMTLIDPAEYYRASERSIVLLINKSTA